MTLVGSTPARPDGWPKVSGSALYVDDITYDDVWHGATLRSPHPYARVTRLGWRPDAAPAGCVFVSAATMSARNGVRLLDDSWPILADGVVRHVGEPVALVAGPTRDDARRALEAIDVEYEPLPPRLRTDDDAPELLAHIHQQRGNPDGVFATAPIVVEGTYDTGHQEHVYLECQGMVAWFEADGGVVVEGSMQCPYYVHAALRHALDLPAAQVRVRAASIGGGFGGKEDFPSALALHAALLARASGHRVKIVYDRHEDIIGTTKRHPATMRYRTAVDADGHLLAAEIAIVLDGGAYRTLSPVVLSRAVLHALGPYRCPHVRVDGRVVATHTLPNGAFRGFGVPQVAFAAERQMDAVARRVGLDPYEIRRRNVLHPGDALPTGQVLGYDTRALDCLDAVVRKTDFVRKWHACEQARAASRNDDAVQADARAHGIGLSLYFHGSGFTGNGERHLHSAVTVRLDTDGQLELRTAMTDMGQGCAIVFPQIAADAAGLPLDDVRLAVPDTAVVPDSGPTVASRTTMIVGGLLAVAARDVRDAVLSWIQWVDGVPGLEMRDGLLVSPAGPHTTFRDAARRCVAAQGPIEITRHHEPAPGQTFDDATYTGSAYPNYAWGADVIEVTVDRDVLETSVQRATVVCDVGRVVHPTLCAGQVEGGTLQAIGYALMEEMRTENGRYLNDRLATYIVPTCQDSPRLDVSLWGTASMPGTVPPATPKGVGELPMDGAAPAVVQAIENATGIAVTTLPATPERLFSIARTVSGAEGAQ